MTGTLAGRLLAASFGIVAAVVVAWIGLEAVAPTPVALTLAVSATAVGGVVLWAVIRRLVLPLRSLTEAAERVASGDTTARFAAGGPVEVARLSEALARAASAFQHDVAAGSRDRRRLEQILSALEEGILLLEDGDAPTYENPAARRLLGGGASRQVTRWPPALRELAEEVRTAGRPVQRDLATGAPGRAVLAAGTPLGSGPAVLIVLRDITEARRTEVMRRDFVADASHELKTPVASIRAAAETVHRAVREDPQAAPRFTEHLRREAERLARIVSDLLDLSRLESERPVFDDVRLDRVAEEEVAAVRDRAAAAGVAVDVTVSPVAIRGSAEELSLLLANLLDNSLRYNRAGGRVEVDVRTEGEVAVVRVADTGVGISSRDLPRIFERFYRADGGRSRDTGGTGLGLSIARHVVERHGGTIEAHSELGRGSTFVVRLPRTDQSRTASSS